ncbi:hypothetical protein [Methylorubrum extorquens]
MDKWFEPIPLTARISLSALGGCLSGWLFFLFAAITRRGLTLHLLYDAFFGGLFFVPITLVLATPALLVALVVGAIFRRQIAQHTALWTIAASFVTWVTAIFFMVFTGSHNEWSMTHSIAERLAHTIASEDSKLILVGALGAGATFYLLGLIRLGPERAA